MVEKASDALRSIDTANLTASEIVRLADVGTRLERTALGEPIAIERVQHAAPDNGPMRTMQAFEPPPEFMAEVLRILETHDALPGAPPVTSDPAESGHTAFDASNGAVPRDASD
jgi:hypothetical protein